MMLSEERLVCLKQVHDLFEAELIKGKLEQEGIDVFIKKEALRDLYGLTINGIGKIEIIIKDDDLKKANDILNE